MCCCFFNLVEYKHVRIYNTFLISTIAPYVLNMYLYLLVLLATPASTNYVTNVLVLHI